MDSTSAVVVANDGPAAFAAADREPDLDYVPGFARMVIAGVWCWSSTHESQHFIVEGLPACKTAHLERWDAWRLVLPDDADVTKQCTRCRGHLGPPGRGGAGSAASPPRAVNAAASGVHGPGG